MFVLSMINFLSVVLPSVISRREISFLVVDGCTAGNLGGGYRENAEKLRTADGADKAVNLIQPLATT
jgi:hypothetical protein